jgi:RAB protein geranylgeranyltransferase component A
LPLKLFISSNVVSILIKATVYSYLLFVIVWMVKAHAFKCF